MDANTISVFLSRNRETFKDFLKIMFDDCKNEIQDLCKEDIDLHNENKELQNSIEFVIIEQIISRNASTNFRINSASRLMLI